MPAAGEQQQLGGGGIKEVYTKNVNPLNLFFLPKIIDTETT
jgi:hypothetical protein